MSLTRKKVKIFDLVVLKKQHKIVAGIVMQSFGLCNVPFASIACKTEITALFCQDINIISQLKYDSFIAGRG